MVLDTVADGLHADALLQVERYDVVILDLGLPSLDGIEVLRRIRARGDDVPVLILTASGEVPDRVRGLTAGADDYLPKPFDLHELVARLRALARRHRGRAHAVFKVGALSYDSVAMQFHIAGKPLELPRREHGVLEILVTRSGQPVSKRDISGQLCSLDDAVSPEALELYVHRLRRRLEGSGASIRTLRGLGYRLEAVDDAPA
jgi:two-component system response regulator TctD